MSKIGKYLFNLMVPMFLVGATSLYTSLGLVMVQEKAPPSNRKIDCIKVVETSKVNEEGLKGFICVLNPEERIED